MAVSAQWNSDGLDSEITAGVADGLFEAGEVLLAHSNALVPLAEGILENSGTSDVDGSTVRVGYNTPYALRQHEDLTLNHPNGREAKYLEKPLNALGSDLVAIVAAAIGRRLT
ncbi:hypothetical protein [Nocardia abscessus]|uniref:hypothetical protein n=1 Tax=Nocardia abscessus TaxID=120957 RepID=UPI002453BC11|nr:hypothetical protein [Nocardia abscessus]